MKHLLKTYGLNSDQQYFELIVESAINGNRSQSINQFLELSRSDRVRFITSALRSWESGLTNTQLSVFVEYIYQNKPLKQ